MKNLIKPIAPTLAVALEGPMSGVALKFMSDHLAEGKTVPPGQEESAISEILSDTKNLAKLKETEEAFKAEMANLNVDVYDLVETRKSKREFSDPAQRARMILSAFFLIAYFLILAGIFYVEISDTLNMKQGENSLMGEIQILIGVITAGVGQVLSYWFGGVGSKSGKTQATAK